MAISEDKSGRWSPDKKKSGPSTLERIMFPISNLASLKRGGKVRKKKGRAKSR
jgi:hypothetical protein